MISKHGAEHYRWGAGCDGWHLLKADVLSVIHERMPPGTAEERHLHRASRQFFFVLFGELVLETDGGREVLREHEGVEVAPGVERIGRRGRVPRGVPAAEPRGSDAGNCREGQRGSKTT